jgi:hypothetical protein
MDLDKQTTTLALLPQETRSPRPFPWCGSDQRIIETVRGQTGHKVLVKHLYCISLEVLVPHTGADRS